MQSSHGAHGAGGSGVGSAVSKLLLAACAVGAPPNGPYRGKNSKTREASLVSPRAKPSDGFLPQRAQERERDSAYAP